MKVYSQAGLQAALTSGPNVEIRLARDIRLKAGVTARPSGTVRIDFCGHKITCAGLSGNGNALTITGANHIRLIRPWIEDFHCNGAAIKCEGFGSLLATDAVFVDISYRGPVFEADGKRALCGGHLVTGAQCIAGNGRCAWVSVYAERCALAVAQEHVNYLCCSQMSYMTGHFVDCGCIMQPVSRYIDGCSGASVALADFVIEGRPRVPWNRPDDLHAGTLLYASQPGDRLLLGPGTISGDMGDSPMVHLAPGARDARRTWCQVMDAGRDVPRVQELGTGWMGDQ